MQPSMSTNSFENENGVNPHVWCIAETESSHGRPVRPLPAPQPPGAQLPDGVRPHIQVQDWPKDVIPFILTFTLSREAREAAREKQRERLRGGEAVEHPEEDTSRRKHKVGVDCG